MKVFKKDTRRIIALYYHSVNFKESELFAQQLEFISEFAKFVSPLEELNSENQINVLITFDDALLSVLQNAQPALVKKGVPFVVFVPFGKLGQVPDWHIDSPHKTINERVMSENELRMLDKEFCTIGSHTITHPHLSHLSNEAMKKEIYESKIFIEGLIDRPVNFISFPYGDYNNYTHRYTLDADYVKAFTVGYKSISSDWNGFLLGRIASSPTDWKIELFLKIHGGYNWIGKRQKKIADNKQNILNH